MAKVTKKTAAKPVTTRVLVAHQCATCERTTRNVAPQCGGCRKAGAKAKPAAKAKGAAKAAPKAPQGAKGRPSAKGGGKPVAALRKELRVSKVLP